jgi:hypothetical protein
MLSRYRCLIVSSAKSESSRIKDYGLISDKGFGLRSSGAGGRDSPTGTRGLYWDDFWMKLFP